MCWQISVTIMSFGDHAGGEQNGSQNLCTIVRTHNDLCTCITLTKWNGPVACVNVTENVENFQSKCNHFTATKTSVTVSEAIWTWQSYTFSDDFKGIKTIVAQHVRDLFSSAAERPAQRRDWSALATWNHEFSNTNLEIFFLKMYGIQDRHLWDDVWKCPKLIQDGMLNMSSWYKPRLNFTAVGL